MTEQERKLAGAIHSINTLFSRLDKIEAVISTLREELQSKPELSQVDDIQRALNGISSADIESEVKSIVTQDYITKLYRG